MPKVLILLQKTMCGSGNIYTGHLSWMNDIEPVVELRVK